MADLDALLDAYPSLSPSDRVMVDVLAGARPERQAAYAEARRLAALVDAASAQTSAADLARVAVARRLGGAPPEAARADRDREASADLARHQDAIEERLDELEAEAEDPLALFERLTGQPLPDLVQGPRTAPSGPNASGPRLPAVARAVMAAALLAVGYGVLYAASTARATVREQVADLGAVGAVWLPSSRAGPLAQAFTAVRHARRSTLGLFPHYDPAGLDRAAQALAAEAAAAEAPSWQSQEARLTLARVHLYRQRDVDAARVLGGLVREGGTRAPAARRILDFIRAQGAA